MKKALFIFVVLFSLPMLSHAQETSTWKTLSKVTFKKEMDEFMGMEIEKPVYMQSVLDLSGEEITVKGYIIPLKLSLNHGDVNELMYTLSNAEMVVE